MISYITPKKLVPEPPTLIGHSTDLLEIKVLETEYFRTLPQRSEQSVEMIWLTKGRFQVMFDLETFDVSGGMILFLVPGQQFHIRSVAELEGVILRFPAGFIPVELDSPYPNLAYCSSRMFEVDALSAASIMSVIQCMRGELKNSHIQKMEVLSGYIKIILIYLLRQRSTFFRSGFNADMAQLARRFLDLLERRYHVNKKVSDYADELAVTPNYLNHVVKQETGMSVSANIKKRLLLQAKRMALLQGVSMKAIAYKLGFDDTAHFSKFFKMGCGCNFTTYRKTCPG